MIDFACVSSTTPTWSNDPRWCIPGIAATEAEHAKLAADRASSAPVQGVHRYYPFVVEDRGRLAALTVVYIFAEVALKNPKTLAEAVQAALAVEAAERETDVHREIRRERLNIMDDDGDDDEQYYSSAEGEATEQEDDLLMARRLTEEEFERFKKEGRCFTCRAKGHVASACPSKKKKISEYRPRKTRPGN
eukprot:jgi/Tetstr1/457320/TSEL_043924.t1